MAIDSRKSREAERFDAYRVKLMRTSVPVSKEPRKAWFERFQKFVEGALPEPKKLFQKPGLVTRMFAAEIEVPHSHARDLEAMAQHLDILWEASTGDEVKEFITLITPDRRDLVWEFAADLGDCYVTGSVKLRNYSFDRESGGRRPFRRDGRGDRDNRDDRGGRPSYRGSRDRDNRDDRGGRPSYRGSRDRDNRDGRGGRPPYRGSRDRDNRDGRGGRPPYRGDRDRDNRDGRGGRPPYRGDRDRDNRDGRGGRPPYRGDRDRDNRGERGGRPPFRGKRDSGYSKRPGRPPFKKRRPKD